MSAEEEFEKAAQEMDAQKTEVIEALAVDETAEMPEAAADDSEGADGQADPSVEDDDDEGEKKSPLPFWTRGKAAAVGGIAAALVLGVVGIAAISMPQADTAPEKDVQAVQKADASKTSVAKTGEKAPGADAAAGATEVEAQDQADPAQQATSPEEEATAVGENAAAPDDATQSADAAATPSSGGSQASKKPAASSGSSGSAAPKSESKPAASEPKKQEHVHSWEPVYEKKWKANLVTVTVTDTEAWDEPVYEKVAVCKCGEQFSSASEAAAHAEEYAMQGVGGHSYSSKKVQVDTIHHDAVTHTVQEDHGSYENVKVGEKCSSCGATK